MSYSTVPELLSYSQLDLNITVGEHKNIVVSSSVICVTRTAAFVGAFLLAELLSIHPSDCKFICLVRCKSSMNPLDRIRQNMLSYQI